MPGMVSTTIGFKAKSSKKTWKSSAQNRGCGIVFSVIFFISAWTNLEEAIVLWKFEEVGI